MIVEAPTASMSASALDQQRWAALQAARQAEERVYRQPHDLAALRALNAANLALERIESALNDEDSP